MAAELCSWLPADVALERARNVAMALSDGETDPVDAVVSIVGPRLVDLPWQDRVSALDRTVEAWMAALPVPDLPQPDLCSRCQGSGGGSGPLRCYSCRGTGELRRSRARVEYDDGDIPW
jgi:hypothetical protein